jgi:pimeloyl-ACP methyl ester carboxylesterase
MDVLPQVSPGVYWAKTDVVRTADGADIRYRVLADPDRPAGPAVVLLSGFLCPDTWWHFLVPELLEDGYRVVLLHYRGIATSTMPPVPVREALSVERYAQDVLDVLHAAGVHEASFVGHSMGGQVMVEVARRIPERVVSMTSVTGAWRSPTKDLYGQGWLVSPVTAGLVRLLRLLPGPMGTATWRTVWRTLPFLPIGRAATAFGPLTPGAIVDSYEAHARQLTGEYFVEALAAMHEHDPGEDLEHLHAPTLVITGDGDPFTPPGVARRMAERLPRAELLVVEQATHGAILEHPRLVNDAIRGHLARVTGHVPVGGRAAG